MKSINCIMSITAGVLALVYDLWMIQAGHLPAVTLLALVGWMALLLAVCARQQKRRNTASVSA
ncbi:MAG: hypothetical protein QNJ40_12375 [Xanthomonadales bacterium]|nr:hypothetical protein [Xanthomonadales bacterium]